MNYVSGKGVDVLDSLPVATLQPVFFGNEKVEAEKSRAVVVEGKVITFCSDHYELVNHKDAFLQALHTMEVPLNKETEIQVFGKNGYASMKCVFPELTIADDKLGIKMGFEIQNSIDKTSSLGIEMKRSMKDKSDAYIVFTGYRQVCSNGMKIRVPMLEMFNADEIRQEEKGVIERLMASFTGRVKHMGKNFAMKYTDLLLLARKSIPSIEATIQKAMAKVITREEFAKALGEMGFSDRNIEMILNEFDKEKATTTWQAYNNITAIASHNIKSQAVADKMLDRAWDLMESVKVRA